MLRKMSSGPDESPEKSVFSRFVFYIPAVEKQWVNNNLHPKKIQARQT